MGRVCKENGKLTGALGLMITLGAKRLVERDGVPGPPALPWEPSEPDECCEGIKGPPDGGTPFGVTTGDPYALLPNLPAASSGGKGLFRDSFNAVVEDVGVPWFEEMGDCEWTPWRDAEL